MSLIVAVLLAGCRQPWYAAGEPSSDRIAEAGDRLPPARAGSLASDAAPETTTDDVGADPFDQVAAKPSGEDALAEIVKELEQVDDIDAATREELIADLRAADPDHWPLIVRHLKATLAYRRQAGEAEPEAGTADSPDQITTEQGAAKQADAAAAVASDEPAGDSLPSTVPQQAAPADANDLAVAFVADDGKLPADRSDTETHSAAVDKVPTPLPEPEPAEAPLTIAAAPQPIESSPVPQSTATESPAAAPTGNVVAAAFEEPIYQTSGAAAVTSAAESGASAAESGERTPIAELPTDELLDLAIARLEAETSDAPATSGEIARHARLRLLHLVADNNAAALTPIAGIPASQQDFWAKQLFGLSTYLDSAAQPDVRQRAVLAQRHLQEATDQLGEVALLEVRNLAFCSSIGGFGIYEPLQRPKLKAGEQVKLYAEVGNYRSESTEDGYRTLLATSYQVVDENDRRVDSGEFPQVEDLCRSRRRDFHIQYGVNLPTRIYPGKYRLQLTIEDLLSRKLGQASVEFEIVDDGAATQ